jgi:hypothetical protein
MSGSSSEQPGSGLARRDAVAGVMGGPLALGLLLCVVLPSCHREEPRGETAAAAPSAAGAAAPAVEHAAPSGPEIHEDTFDLVVRPTGTYSVGKPGSVDVQVSAKGGYHCNDKYPYKFKVGDSPGVRFAAPVFTKDALTLEQLRATMKLDFTPESPGKKTIAGSFAFSLCSAERCLVEKRDVSLEIAVD